MKRRERPDRPPPSGGVPAELRIGPMVEVWASDGRDELEAFQRFRDARHQWLVVNGYDVSQRRRTWPEVLRTDRGPYSLSRLRTEHPDHACDLLADFGLPADWQPPRYRRPVRHV